MNEEQFKQLITRYESGKATAAEIKLLENWLERRAQSDLYSKLTPEEKGDIKDNVRRSLQRRIAENDTRSRQRTLVTWLMRTAAAVLLLILSTYFVWQWTKTGKTTGPTMLQASASRNNKKVILTDGTIVWLKPNSILTYPSLFEWAERTVSITGEALFEVAKDASHPFLIQCGDLTAKVLGTSFNIKSGNGNIEVTVLTGKVSLYSFDHKHDLVVVANEKAVYNEVQDLIAKVELKKEEADQTVRGTEYSMDFEDTPMREIARRIEGKFNVTITMEDEQMKNCRITADLTDQSLDRALAMIAQSLGFEYEIKNAVVTMRGKGCNNN